MATILLDTSAALAAPNISMTFLDIRPGEEEQTKAFLQSLEFFAVTQEIAAQPGCFAATGDRRGKPFPTPM